MGTTITAITAVVMMMACQGAEPGSEVLRNRGATTITYVHYDITTKVTVKGADADDIRYVLKIGFNSNNKPTTVLVRSIKNDGENFSGDDGCVDRFDNPNLTNSPTTIKASNSVASTDMVFDNKRKPIFYSYQFGSLIASFKKEGNKGSLNGIKKEDREKFDEKYFPADAEECEEESPSATATNGP